MNTCTLGSNKCLQIFISVEYMEKMQYCDTMLTPSTMIIFQLFFYKKRDIPRIQIRVFFGFTLSSTFFPISNSSQFSMSLKSGEKLVSKF